MRPRQRFFPSLPDAAAALRLAGLRGLWAADDLLGLWRRRHATRRDLAALPPRLLRDIGLTPDEARREADKPFWRG